MDISSEQIGKERSREGLHLKKRKYDETFVDVVTETLEQYKKSKSVEEKNKQLEFLNLLAEAGIKLKQIFHGSIIMILEFEGIPALLCFGALYNSGIFKNMLTHGFITEHSLAFHGLSSVMLRVEVKKEDYLKCLEVMGQGKHCNISLRSSVSSLFLMLHVYYVSSLYTIVNNEDIK